jgi:hypothetical protein
MSTILAFSTPLGGLAIAAGGTKQLGPVDVSPYSKIRVVANERRPGSLIDPANRTGINIRLCTAEANIYGVAVTCVAQLDVFQLLPGSQVTRVYDVPGTNLFLFADAIAGQGSDCVDLLIYGS